MRILIGFLGGLITGISPCILPVLPVIFFSGAQNARSASAEADGAVSTEVKTKPTLSETLRPYRVIAGLVLSFSLVTLAGTALLSLLHLPQDALRWAGLIALTVIGLGLIFPRFEEIIEKPFSIIPQWQARQGKSGFGLGLAVGVLYVPCAGPVLAAIVVAGATGNVGLPTIVLTLAFAVGAALPLLLFALAGRRIAERVGAFRRHQRRIRLIGGIVMLAFAVALAFNVPAALQRAIPDYTSGLQDTVAGSSHIQNDIQNKLNLGGLVSEQNAQLSNCTNGAPVLEDCGTAPDLKGITGWLNTPGGTPIDLKSLRGKVVLVDFWAYSCINCQRAIPHFVDWYRAYKDAGFEVIGVHTPEYAFERVPENVASGAKGLGMTYPIALDPNYSTWTNYRNRYWPAEYLIDANGIVRHLQFGEGDYDATENLVRQLLTAAHPGVQLPAATERADTTPTGFLTPETYLGVGKVGKYGGTGAYGDGSATFAYPDRLPDDTFAYRGPWSLDDQGATSGSDQSSIALNYHATNVYLVVGGTGTVTVLRDGHTTTVPVSGAPNMRQIVAGNSDGSGHIEVQLSQGLQAFSFTYG